MICQGSGRPPIAFFGADHGVCPVCARSMRLRDDDDSMPDHDGRGIHVDIEVTHTDELPPWWPEPPEDT